MKINDPISYNHNATKNYKLWEPGKNIEEFLINCINKNKNLSESQIIELCGSFYSHNYVATKLRNIPQIKRKLTKNYKTGRKIFVYYI